MLPLTEASFLGICSVDSAVTTRIRAALASSLEVLSTWRETLEISRVPVSQPRRFFGRVVCMPLNAKDMFALVYQLLPHGEGHGEHKRSGKKAKGKEG